MPVAKFYYVPARIVRGDTMVTRRVFETLEEARAAVVEIHPEYARWRATDARAAFGALPRWDLFASRDVTHKTGWRRAMDERYRTIKVRGTELPK